ncbi:MAG TPA: hypothetical protein PLF31_03265, partial [Candidatus Paceibacterota bacterium]|nr:hypothetical protein [Candidatus Paceibacterota bacterium]
MKSYIRIAAFLVAILFATHTPVYAADSIGIRDVLNASIETVAEKVYCFFAPLFGEEYTCEKDRVPGVTTGIIVDPGEVVVKLPTQQVTPVEPYPFVVTPQVPEIVEHFYNTETVQIIREVSVPGITREEVLAQIDARFNELTTASTYNLLNRRLESLREDVGDRISDLSGDINNLEDDLENIDFDVDLSAALAVTDTSTSSIAGPLSLAQYILLESVTSPADTTNSLYNDGGDLYWQGTLLAGGIVGTWDSNGTDVYRSTGNVGIGSTTPGYLLSVAGTSRFTGASIFDSTVNITGQTTLANASSTNFTVSTN